MRLDKLLSDMNIGTRSELKKNIRKGQVSVNGEVIKDPGISLNGDEKIIYCGEEVSYSEFEYYMMNKPAGVLSATNDKRQKTVLDLIDGQHRKDLFPVGRLDKDTVGLLLITNNGKLAHELLSPSKHVDKTYLAKVDGVINEDDVKAFEKGIKLDDDFTTLPAKLEIKDSSGHEAFVTIHEGKFHEIKRMFHACGKEVVYLKRLSMGAIRLDENLKEGEYRPLSRDEILLLNSDV
ncbi:MAG: rRNA pseudouridine synthase [Lachnospiraceae bacterium]|nr:rRNA pseudouridine synthase [Lachnospiraceae bacterium]